MRTATAIALLILVGPFGYFTASRLFPPNFYEARPVSQPSPNAKVSSSAPTLQAVPLPEIAVQRQRVVAQDNGAAEENLLALCRTDQQQQAWAVAFE